ncbi:MULTISPECIES: hypothetical protein [unclassified Novosphingobium]|uniref:hypothetical protein n=1 Tax=unclassified Novosphingobium TaxID=2644732 RepID=UPI00146EC6D1|nr:MULTISPECIES: hypothetical protein [unclassified Novosphingobium]NMN06798.1 hypothetical protein [Novosphingobium sp. SG919]NMN88751.1 hypothetical protein [Novosphingobium sp. SG916]
MPLVFVHGVANRPSAENAALKKQRDALFRSLVFGRDDTVVLNPDWGSFAVTFGEDLPWLPGPKGNEAFDAGGDGAGAIEPAALDGVLDLGTIAASDAEQAIDLVAMAALDAAIVEAAMLGVPEAAATGEAMAFAEASAAYLEAKGLVATDKPAGVGVLATAGNSDFAEALEAEIDAAPAGVEAFGLGDRIRDAFDHLARMVGNGASDAVLKAKRRDLSRGVSLFLGDIFVYLRGRDDASAQGTRARIFKPILTALAEAAKAPRVAGEPLVVVGHSLGGVILYDMLTDPATRTELETAIGGPIKIDALFTVGSQPGFFADLGMYPGGRPAPGTKLPMPVGVDSWMNVFDFTDVFSFKCDHIFEGVRDFGYDTVTDLLHAHSAYFLRPSFYKRMRVRLSELGLA